MVFSFYYRQTQLSNVVEETCPFDDVLVVRIHLFVKGVFESSPKHKKSVSCNKSFVLLKQVIPYRSKNLLALRRHFLQYLEHLLIIELVDDLTSLLVVAAL